MKTIKYLFLAGLLGCFMAVFNACSNGSKGYVINGQVEGLDDGTVVTLVPMSHDNDSAIAEADPSDFDFDKIMEGAAWFHWSGITP